MQSCLLYAHAKINPYLKIIGKRPDGYHEVAMVLQSIDLYDTLHLHLIGSEIRVICNHPEVPNDPSNLAHRAALLLQATCGARGGVEIRIEKRIPVAAGLAGGSADAAAVLVGLNQLWKLGLAADTLQALAAQLGSDIPFCISGGTQLASGRGELLKPLPSLPSIALLLAKPRDIAISTAWAYQAYRGDAGASPPLAEILAAIGSRDWVRLAHLLHNDLEAPVLAQHPSIALLKQSLVMAGAVGSLMSGSGSTVFGIMPSLNEALLAADRIRATHPEADVWATTTAAGGIRIH